MDSILISCSKSLELLSLFLHGDRKGNAVDMEMIGPEQVPEPYHRLLVHERDMTSTLTDFHGEGVWLGVLEQRVTGGEVLRHVVLRGKRTGRPLEYGAIRIRLDPLTDPARREVLRSEVPLGGILNAMGITYRSCPGGFLRARPQEEIAQWLDLNASQQCQWLYGRCNCLSRGEGGTIAEVVEILPPCNVTQA